MATEKTMHVKPALYAQYYMALKGTAKAFGYNLVLHGSMARDLDLIAIPWAERLGDVELMIHTFADILGGKVHSFTHMENGKTISSNYSTTHHGRKQYVIDLARGGYYHEELETIKWKPDPQYYVDISVCPVG